MKTSKPTITDRNRRGKGPRRPQDRLLFWFAAALIPEAASFHVESPRAMAQRAELLRHAQANDADAEARDAA